MHPKCNTKSARKLHINGVLRVCVRMFIRMRMYLMLFATLNVK